MSNPETRHLGSKASLLGHGRQASLQVPMVSVEVVNREATEASLTQGTKDKMQMPAGQAGRVTKAYNRLMTMKEAGSVEAVVLQQIQAVQRELKDLKVQCDEVQPDNAEQVEFKKVWMQKYLYSKEQVLLELQAALEDSVEQADLQVLDDRQSVQSSMKSCRTRASVSSSVRKALIQAEEEQARLEMKRKQLADQQKQRRHQQERRRIERQRQEEEEERLLQQQERDELDQQLAGIRVRRAALSRAASEAGHSLIEGVVDVERTQGPERASVEAWLNETPRPAPERPEGGFVQVSPLHHRLDPQDQLLQHVVLAQAKLPVFKGDPLEFLWFERAFDAQVTSVTADPARRLYLLLQQLQGPPHDLVKGCQLMVPQEGYKRARQKLKERYGHPVRQAMAFRGKLLAWPLVKSAAEIDAFNVQLQMCLDVKLAGSGLAELDSPATLLQLAAKLPSKLQLSWQAKAFDVEEREQREATFTDFVKFIGRQAGLRCHPVYGKLSGDKESRQDLKGSEKKGVRAAATEIREEEATAATQAARSNKEASCKPPLKPPSKTMSKGASQVSGKVSEEPNAFQAPCLLCDQNHSTVECKDEKLSRKERYERLKGLCFACLKPGHLARRCEDRAQCTRCNAKHPTILHREEGPKSEERSRPKDGEKAMATRGSSTMVVATVPIKVWHGADPRRTTIVQAVLDPASTATFITDSLRKTLGLQADQISLGITTMTDQAKMAVGMVQGLHIGDLDGNSEFVVPTSYTVKGLPFDIGVSQTEVERWPHLRGVPFHWEPEAPVAMLIGLNVAGALMPEETIKGDCVADPYAVKTPLGWTVHGSSSAATPDKARVFWTKVNDVKSQLERMYYADFKDAFQFRERGESQEDAQWRDLVQGSMNRVLTDPSAKSYQYVIDLPFRSNGITSLQNNYHQALQRMQHLGRKFAAHPQFKKDYWAFMDKMAKGGYIEEVDRDDVGNPSASYVIHHGVYHPKKPGKIRVVFNCASKFKGLSLNDCLLQGPDLTNSLVGVLLRFRQHRVAFMADIESMFYRVQVTEKHRDVLRFLWWKEGGEEEGPLPFRLKVHLFGATSSPSVANFALRQAAQEACKAGLVNIKVQKAVERNFYVDDCLRSAKDEQEAIELAHGLVQACAYGGFRLTKFTSTSCALLRSFPKTELAADLENVDLNEDKKDPLGSLQERALGVMWNLTRDQFCFKVNMCKDEACVTKRKVLSRLSAVYDPLGIASPVIIVARMLFRELTKSESGWDEPIDKDQQSKWHAWEEELHSLQNVGIPRCLKMLETKDVQLHVFCDASIEAYAAVAYLRESESSKATRINFVMGKARVAPPKVVTIPRLELTAAKLAGDLAELIGREMELPMVKRVFWSDSTTVLKYIRNKTKRFHVFVANRVCSILASTKQEEWRYVPTKDNPSDDATRGKVASELASCKWLQGPMFLREPESEWPEDPEVALTDNDPEIRQEVKTAGTIEDERSNLVETWSTTYSSMGKVRRVAAAWLRVRAWLRGAREARWVQRQWSLRELQKAEQAALIWLQRWEWPKEIEALTAGKTVVKTSPLFKLNPMVGPDGLLLMSSRVRTRIPIVPSGAFGRLLIQEVHEQQCHLGRSSTAAGVQRRYWIIKLGKMTRDVVRKCPACQRRHAQPLLTSMAPLPPFRAQAGLHAFAVTGVDYFGPFHVRQGRGRRKAYGVIFTCAASRAVHLEVSENLTGGSFINTLRRFIARRGSVSKFISDNGTNFVGAQTLLKAELAAELKRQQNDPSIQRQLAEHDIEWQFNVPGASHHGGFWERLIRSIRSIMSPLLERNVLTYDSLVTVLCECEAVLNNRPITPVSEDPDDLEALTPNHLLLGRPTSSDSGMPGDFDSTAGMLRHQWRRVQHVANEFWRRWCHEYRPLLHQRAKWHSKAKRNLKVNDPVLVVDPLHPREQWRLARVLKVYRGADNEVRSADVKTKQGLLTRPITKLCLLEAASENE